LPYELLDEAGETRADVGAHLLSPKDLASIGALPEFARIGVAALKIEGRMKRPDYVALVTGVYRSALDRALEHPEDFAVRDGEMSVLAEAFSRGFTHGYLYGERGNDMMSYRRPNNRGVPLGRILAARGGRAAILLEASVDADDTIEIWTSQGRLTRRIGPLEYGSAEHPSAPAGTKAVVSVDGTVSAGDRVFRVRNASLSAAAARSYAEPQGDPIPLAISARVVIGQPLRVDVVDSLGRAGAAEGPPVELARTRAVTADEIAEHVGRLGGTPYVPGSWDIELSPRAGIGFSALHAARRDALSDYEACVLAPWQGRHTTTPEVPSTHRGRRSREETPRIVAVVGNLEAARACLDAGADEVHLASHELNLAVGDGAIVPVVPRVLHDRDRERVMSSVLSAGRGVAGNVGALWTLASAGCSVQAHWSLNTLNAYAAQEFTDIGAGFVWLSPELTLRQVARVAGESSVPTGIAVAGRQELMVTEHCILMAEGSCTQDCSACSRRREVRGLKDRKGYRFPVVTDAFGRTHLYNSIPLDLTAAMREVLATGVSALRLDLEIESPRRAATEVVRVRAAVSAAGSDTEVRKPPGPVTSGHAFRGVG
jgi:putative protease